MGNIYKLIEELEQGEDKALDKYIRESIAQLKKKQAKQFYKEQSNFIVDGKGMSTKNKN
jgi:hypothetical protein